MHRQPTLPWPTLVPFAADRGRWIGSQRKLSGRRYAEQVLGSFRCSLAFHIPLSKAAACFYLASDGAAPGESDREHRQTGAARSREAELGWTPAPPAPAEAIRRWLDPAPAFPQRPDQGP